MSNKRVAWFTGQASHNVLTPNKVYAVFNEDGDSFNTTDDKGGTRFCIKRGCSHICRGNWVLADIVEEEKVETLKRIGVVDLLPEDSEFTLGQEVIVVDSALYSGKAILRGCEYNRDGSFDGYIVETPEKHGSPDDGGLCKGGFALWVRDKGIKSIVEQTKPKKAKKWPAWLPHTNDEQPVADDVIIKVKFSDGTTYKEEAGNWSWFKPKSDGDGSVRFYKVKLKDQEKPKSKWTKNTGVNPLNTDACVKIVRRDSGKVVMKARYCDWSLSGHSYDIIKWRLAD